MMCESKDERNMEMNNALAGKKNKGKKNRNKEANTYE